MSRARQVSRPGSDQARRRAAAKAARNRRRLGIGIAGLAILVVASVIVGLHLANQPDRSAGTATGAAVPTAIVPTVGRVAPSGAFTTPAGATASVASLRGTPTLVWFVTTWCTSCQAGTQLLAQDIAKFRADGVRVVELELYQDLGQSGPSIASFASSYAGAAATNPDWSFGVASAGLTRTYDPRSYLELYYLLNAKGRVTYVNAPLVSTMPGLLQAAGRLK
ncbi:MAG: TlpA family protein disulfide reductase [Acidimicrobiales bacterium]